MPEDEREQRLIGALLRIPFEAVNLRVNEALGAAGYGDIRPAHQTVFQHLGAGGARVTALAERAQITKQSMGALVDYLEQRGYVERVPDPTDGRASIVRHTERGRAVERTARAAIAQVEAEWAASLGEDRLRELRQILRDLGAILGR